MAIGFVEIFMLRNVIKPDFIFLNKFTETKTKSVINNPGL